MAALLGVVVLHELLSVRQWLAVALIIAASTGSALTSRRPAPVVGGEAGEGWQGGCLAKMPNAPLTTRIELLADPAVPIRFARRAVVHHQGRGRRAIRGNRIATCAF